MLELPGLCIVAFLPSELPDKAVAQPDHQNNANFWSDRMIHLTVSVNGKAGIIEISLVFEEVTTPEVPVHECP